MYKPDEEDIEFYNDRLIIYDRSVTIARLLKEIEDVKKYAELIINFNYKKRSDNDNLYVSGKKIGAQMMLDRLNKIKVEGA